LQPGGGQCDHEPPTAAAGTQENSMKTETQEQTGHDDKEPPRAAWFATFTFLDTGGAIGSSQLQHLLAPVKKLWRRAVSSAT
jgi:hypothetical protein